MPFLGEGAFGKHTLLQGDTLVYKCYKEGIMKKVYMYCCYNVVYYQI